jgi:predicted DNA-binding transcriptional regulator AlpA
VDESFTIDEFCAGEKISRSFFYKLDKIRKAPTTYKLGRSRRISRASYDAWRAERDAASAAA